MLTPTSLPSPRRLAAAGRPPTPAQSNAEVLLWQSRIRLGFAVLVGGMAFALITESPPARPPVIGFVSLVSYLAITFVLALAARRRGEAGLPMVVLQVAADIVFVFGITYLAVPPPYYDRTLLFGFAILHLTEFYFGRALAWAALGAIVAGYVAMVAGASAHGAALVWSQEIWSLVVFGAAAGSFIHHYGSFRRRLSTIVALFERAEEGDFSGAYDLGAEPRPDMITAVGRAYNRVRTQLANFVLTDPLSGCLNRRGLEQQLARELSRAARSGQEIALLALDVDHFKTINDSCGHLAGDAVVQELGELLREVARGGDIVARTGGDEFTLLLPETSAAGAFRLATRIKDAVLERRFQGVGGRLPVSVSIGLVADRVSDENIAHDLHSRADEALYAAKDGGRNRVSIWTPNLRAIAVTRAGREVFQS